MLFYECISTHFYVFAFACKSEKCKSDIQVNLFPLPKIQEPRAEHSALPQANMVTTEYQTCPQNML